MTAAVIVGEKLTTMTTNSAIIVSLARPVAWGATGSQGHAIQATANRPTMAMPSVTAVTRNAATGPEPFRLMVSRNHAISVVPGRDALSAGIGSEIPIAR